MATRNVQDLAWQIPAAADFQEYQTDVSEGMVVLDAVHQIQAESCQ